MTPQEAIKMLREQEKLGTLSRGRIMLCIKQLSTENEQLKAQLERAIAYVCPNCNCILCELPYSQCQCLKPEASLNQKEGE